MIIDLSEVRKRSLAVDEYLCYADQAFRDVFLHREQPYQLKICAVDQIRDLASRYVIVAFSASWCKDCAQQIPILALISAATKFEVRVFGGIKKDPLSHISKWRVPPSPPEIISLGVDRLPTIIIFDAKGLEVGRIVEHPRTGLTLEEELCEIVKSGQR